MADGKPGNGSSSPFGNGMGATSSGGASSGGHDFIKEPKSNVGGAHDFIKDPSGTKTGPTPNDFVKSPGGGAMPAQKTGPAPDMCPTSVPPGGTTPFKGEPKPNESGGKPFKV